MEDNIYQIDSPFKLKYETIRLLKGYGLSFQDNFTKQRILLCDQLKPEAFHFYEVMEAFDEADHDRYVTFRMGLESFIETSGIEVSEIGADEGNRGQLGTYWQYMRGPIAHPSGQRIEVKPEKLSEHENLQILAHELVHSLQEYEAFKPEYKNAKGEELKEEIVAHLGTQYLFILFGIHRPTSDDFIGYESVDRACDYICQLSKVKAENELWTIEELNNEVVRRINIMVDCFIQAGDIWPQNGRKVRNLKTFG